MFRKTWLQMVQDRYFLSWVNVQMELGGASIKAKEGVADYVPFRTNPDIPVLICVHIDRTIRNGLAYRVLRATRKARPCLGLVIQGAHATFGCHPDIALWVLGDSVYLVCGQRGFGLGFITTEHGDAVAVVFVQPVFGAEPHKAVAVLEDARNGVVGQTVRGIDALETGVGFGRG